MGAKLSNPLWTSKEIAQAVHGEFLNDFSIENIEIDSRNVQKGDLFIALKVARDGHDFVENAIASGANGALVANKECAPNVANLVLCNDTMLALENMGIFARRRANIAKRIAITGSVGKTTVKELTAAALAASGKTHKSVKSYNNHWGVPLTLARMPQDTRFGVFEIGMNHMGEIAKLSPQVRPHIAAITSVAPVHIEHFGTIEAIADAKSEIFLGVENGGKVLIPADNPMYSRLMARANDIDGIEAISFGNNEKANSRIIEIKNDNKIRRVRADILGEIVEWDISELGDHWVSNGLCALTLVQLAGGYVEAAASILSNFGALDGRGATKNILLKNGGQITLVDEAYNANPTSIAGALNALSQRGGGRKIAVLGDMLELGSQENQYHADLIDAVIASNPDLVFLAGQRMKHLWDLLPQNMRGAYATTSKDLAPKLCEAILPNDVIMVKGSNGSHMNVIIAAIGALKQDIKS